MAITLFIAGDVVPKGISSDCFCEKQEQIFESVKEYVKNSDFSVVNLEAPIIKSKPTPIRKHGPCLCVSHSTVRVLSNVGFNICTLANNHFFDQGQTGVSETISVCNMLNMSIVGGGKTYKEARTPLIIEKEEKHIAIINACEHEFSIATSEHGGSNPLDLISMQEDIASVRNKADYVLVILHGGIEQYHYPTPRMKRWFRHFIDLGADAVINHHQHCINGYEVYKGKPIFYGLGNFYFPWENNSRPESWQYGYAVRLLLDEKVGFELIPYKQTAEGIILRDKNDFEKEIEVYNLALQDDFLLQQKFDEFIIDRKFYLMTPFFPSFLNNRYLVALGNRGGLGRLYKFDDSLSLKNKLLCESHLETLQRLFIIQTKI